LQQRKNYQKMQRAPQESKADEEEDKGSSNNNQPLNNSSWYPFFALGISLGLVGRIVIAVAGPSERASTLPILLL
jgi:hypothetical protein